MITAWFATDEAGWLPIETAPAGRCLMWVEDSGPRGEGAVHFGHVYIYENPSRRIYRPEDHHGNWLVTHWMPIPEAPQQALPGGRASPPGANPNTPEESE